MQLSRKDGRDLILAVTVAVAAVSSFATHWYDAKKYEALLQSTNDLSAGWAQDRVWLRDVNRQYWIHAVTMAAERGRGEAFSQLLAGQAYEYGQVVKKDEAAAATWYRKAAERGDVSAQVRLGLMYEAGRGVPADARLAEMWYRKAAEQGNEEALIELALAADRGAGGAEDERRAIAQIAKMPHTSQAWWVGDRYKSGRDVPQDLGAAAHAYRLGAEWDDCRSQGRLGMMYRDGVQVGHDAVLALAWLGIAARSCGLYAAVRDSVPASLEERAEAQRLASQWRPGQTMARGPSTRS